MMNIYKELEPITESPKPLVLDGYKRAKEKLDELGQKIRDNLRLYDCACRLYGEGYATNLRYKIDCDESEYADLFQTLRCEKMLDNLISDIITKLNMKFEGNSCPERVDFDWLYAKENASVFSMPTESGENDGGYVVFWKEMYPYNRKVRGELTINFILPRAIREYTIIDVDTRGREISIFRGGSAKDLPNGIYDNEKNPDYFAQAQYLYLCDQIIPIIEEFFNNIDFSFTDDDFNKARQDIREELGDEGSSRIE